jgi:hypothetical protein
VAKVVQGHVLEAGVGCGGVEAAPLDVAVREGQAFDSVSPVVAQHADWFEIPRRDLTAEDNDRVKALARDT